MRATAKRALASGVILSSLLVLAVAYYSPIQEPFHPLNADWNGCSKVAGATSNLTLVSSYDSNTMIGPALLAIIGPGVQFSEQDALQVEHFMKTNGTVLLADDFGTGNGLLELLNLTIRFGGKPLADLAFYSRNPSFPIVVDISQSSFTTNITALVLNHPTNVDIGNSTIATVLAVSSPFSFIDMNGTGTPARNEVIRPYPVIVSVKVGTGTLILVSDPSMFTNEMIGIYDNMRLLQNALISGRGAMFFDEAHLYKAPFTDARIGLKSGVDSIRTITEQNPAGQLVPPAVAASAMMIALYAIRRSAKNGRRVGLRIKLNSRTFVTGSASL